MSLMPLKLDRSARAVVETMAPMRGWGPYSTAGSPRGVSGFAASTARSMSVTSAADNDDAAIAISAASSAAAACSAIAADAAISVAAASSAVAADAASSTAAASSAVAAGSAAVAGSGAGPPVAGLSAMVSATSATVARLCQIALPPPLWLLHVVHFVERVAVQVGLNSTVFRFECHGIQSSGFAVG